MEMSMKGSVRGGWERKNVHTDHKLKQFADCCKVTWDVSVKDTQSFDIYLQFFSGDLPFFMKLNLFCT